MMVLNLVLHEAQMTFTKFQWSINFCIFFFHISAGCQLIEKIKVDSKSIIGALYMIAIFTLQHYFDFLLLHLLDWGCQPILKPFGDSLPVWGNPNLILYHSCRSISFEGCCHICALCAWYTQYYHLPNKRACSLST